MPYSIRDLISNRQRDILWQVVENYIETGEPVPSQTIADKLGVSSATIRNDFVALDELALTISPHTSSGRIPTHQAFKFYIEKVREHQTSLPQRFQQRLENSYRASHNEGETLRNLAKQISDIVQSAVAINMDQDIIFLTGLSYIFGQPEFSSPTEILNVSRAIDELDNNFHKILAKIRPHGQLEILVGVDNPFGASFGTVILPLETHMFTVLGPARMKYDRAVSCLNFVNELYN